MICAEINHNTAPIEIREKIAISGGKVHEAYQYLKTFYNEVFILSTCNRFGIYVNGTDDVNPLLNFLDNYDIPRKNIFLYTTAKEVSAHLFKTACGLDSQVVGEHQIMSQIKDALAFASNENTIGSVLDELIRRALFTGKKARTKTSIGSKASSIASVAFELMRTQKSDFINSNILIIGTGKVAGLMAKMVKGKYEGKLYIASHNINRSEEKAREWGGESISINDIHLLLPKIAVVVGGTDAEVNLFDTNVNKCPRNMFGFESSNPLLLIDMGVPRNFNTALRYLPNINLFDLDDIKKITYRSLIEREKSIPYVNSIVDFELQEFEKWIKAFSVSPIISAYYNSIDTVKENELNWLLSKLGAISSEQRQLIEKFAHRLLRKMSKSPVEKVRNNAIYHNQKEYIKVFKDLFSLGPEDEQSS